MKLSKKNEVKCTICHFLVEDEKEQKWAADNQNHPGVLGPVHHKCYDKACQEDPDLPWTDPISGEVDYDAMSEDLGVANPESEEWEQEEYDP